MNTMLKRTPINKAVKSFNGDEEHDTYIMWDLMMKNNINPNSETSYADFYRTLYEEIDTMVYDLPAWEEEFNARDSKFITNIEIILDKIEEINDVPRPKAILGNLEY